MLQRNSWRSAINIRRKIYSAAAMQDTFGRQSGSAILNTVFRLGGLICWKSGCRGQRKTCTGSGGFWNGRRMWMWSQCRNRLQTKGQAQNFAKNSKILGSRGSRQIYIQVCLFGSLLCGNKYFRMYAEVEKTGKYIQEESIYVQSDRSGKPERALCASGTC